MGKGREKRKKKQLEKGGKKHVVRKKKAPAVAAVTTMPAQVIFEFKAEGDTVYVEADSEITARAKLVAKIGNVPEELLTVKRVEALPDGEELL